MTYVAQHYYRRHRRETSHWEMHTKREQQTHQPMQATSGVQLRSIRVSNSEEDHTPETNHQQEQHCNDDISKNGKKPATNKQEQLLQAPHASIFLPL